MTSKFNRGFQILFLTVIVLSFAVIFFQRFFAGSEQKSDNSQSISYQSEYVDPSITEKLDNPGINLIVSLHNYTSCALTGAGCDSEEATANSLLFRGTRIVSYTLMHPPASGVVETYTAFSNVGMAPKLYAYEGTGFSVLYPFRDIWLAFRDICYGILVLFIIFISVMVMFRMKLGAQTAISVETALPRIVLSLILITFSYAIAGFLIDLMYIFMGISITVLCSGSGICDAPLTVKQYMTAGLGEIFHGIIPAASVLGPEQFNVNNPDFINRFNVVLRLSQSLVSILPNSVQGLVYATGTAANFFGTAYVLALFKNVSITKILSGISAFTFSLGEAPSTLMSVVLAVLTAGVLSILTVPLLVALAIELTMLVLFFRIYFMLLFAYLQLLVYILLSPVFMLFESVPGVKALSTWFRSMVSELITFPAVAIIFTIGKVVVELASPTAAHPYTRLWEPPFLTTPLWTGRVDNSSFVMILGMGVLFLTPELVKMVKEKIGGRGLGVGLGLGTFLMGASVGLMGGMGMFSKVGKVNDFFYGHGSAARGQGVFGFINKYTSRFRNPLRPGGPMVKDLNSGEMVPDMSSADHRQRHFSDQAERELKEQYQKEGKYFNRFSSKWGKGEFDTRVQQLESEWQEKQNAAQQQGAGRTPEASHEQGQNSADSQSQAKQGDSTDQK